MAPEAAAHAINGCAAHMGGQVLTSKGQACSRLGGYLPLAKGLAEGEERFIDLSPALMALLDRLLLQHHFDTDHLFVVLKRNAQDKWGNSTYGRPLDREAVKGLFRYYSQKSGIPIHAHLLRHSHATELIKANWDASYVQKRLGHAQVQTTINTYVHLDDDDLSQKWQVYQEEISLTLYISNSITNSQRQPLKCRAGD